MYIFNSVFVGVLIISLSFATAQTVLEIPSDKPDIAVTLIQEQSPNPEPDVPDVNAKEGADAYDKTPIMTFERLVDIARALDPDVIVQGNSMQMVIQEIPISIITDPKANRMRAFTPFKSLDGVNGKLLHRMMQANFDSALDARYAIARGHLISVFVHPLGELQKNQFIESVGQVVNLVLTFGTTFTSGAMTFGGGDSQNLHRKLIDELLKKGEDI